MTVQELVNQVNMHDLRVVVSYTFNEGYELEDIMKYPDIYKDILESKITYFSKTARYDLVIHIN